jgi:ribonuclease HII
MISESQRLYLEPLLRKNAAAYAIGSASVQEVDSFNIRQATFIAMNRAIKKLRIAPDFVLVDGENLPNAPCASRGIIRGDQKSFTIAAASIIAKVARDNLMRALDVEFPQYRFAKNKGYGTAEHIQILKRIGPSPYHRRTFLNKILGG